VRSAIIAHVETIVEDRMSTLDEDSDEFARIESLWIEI